MQANQNTTNINEKKRHIANRKTNNCEIVFYGLATRSVNIVIQMPIAENSTRDLAVIDRN
jgi:hypothetical protein